MRKGFTIIEVIIVIAMIGFVSLMAAPLLSDVLGKKNLDAFAAEASDALREAQSSVMSGRDNARYGVHFEAGKFAFFRGAAYSAGDADNVVHSLPDFVGVSAVSLTPGGACDVPAGAGNCDVHFADHRGAPAESGTITFTDGAATKTVTVGAAGMIDVTP